MDIVRKIIYLALILLLTNGFLINLSYAVYIPKEKEHLITKEFLGIWSMQTIVTKSNCPYVIVGTTTKSKLEIKPTITKKSKGYSLKALWKGGKWRRSIGFIKLLNEKEAITERITEIKTDGQNKWKAILIDHLHLDENNIMHSESIVIQYRNGRPVGEYKTFSILTKAE